MFVCTWRILLSIRIEDYPRYTYTCIDFQTYRTSVDNTLVLVVVYVLYIRRIAKLSGEVGV